MLKTHKMLIKILIACGAVIILIILGIGFLFAIAPFDFFEEEHASDQDMQKYFVEHQSRLNHLVVMSNEDEDVIRIAPDFTRLEDNWAWPRPETELGFSQERWNEYKAIFKEIGSRTGLDRGSDGSVYIVMTARGMLDSGSSKGYVYTIRTPSPLVDSANSAPENSTVYKKIFDNWYIFFSG